MKISKKKKTGQIFFPFPIDFQKKAKLHFGFFSRGGGGTKRWLQGQRLIFSLYKAKF